MEGSLQEAEKMREIKGVIRRGIEKEIGAGIEIYMRKGIEIKTVIVTIETATGIAVKEGKGAEAEAEKIMIIIRVETLKGNKDLWCLEL